MSNNNNIIFLSHHLSESTPLYGNGKGISFKFDKNIDHGDSCNTMNLSFPNHSSTHIDFPCHFNNKGKNLNDYPADFWEFFNVDIIDLTGKVSDCQIVGPELLNGFQGLITDLLIIKTGYEKYRGTDRYTLTPPGLSSELSDYIRKNCPMVRCIGMDLISIGSYANREEGHKAHHSFLNPSFGEPILIIEDMKLDNCDSLERVIVSPLLLDKADGAPCTIIGHLRNEN